MNSTVDNNECSKRTAVIVLGMHRSGTSAMAGCLSQSGVEFGKKLIGAQQEVNEKGFFEHSEVVALNDRILRALRSSWDDPFDQDFSHLKECELSEFEDEIVQILNDDFLNISLFGVKDPRITILLPIWLKALKKANVGCLFIHMLRSPAEVAASLRKRDNKSETLSALLWLKYNLAAIRELNFTNHHFISFSRLLSEPSQVASSIFPLLDKFQLDDDSFSNFVSERLRHHQATCSGLNDNAIDTYMRQIFNYAESVEQFRDLRSYELLRQQAESFRMYSKFFSSTLSDDLYRSKYLNEQALMESLYKEIANKDRAIHDIEKLASLRQEELRDVTLRMEEAELLLSVRDQELIKIQNQLIETDKALSDAQEIAYAKEESINLLAQEISRLEKRHKDIVSTIKSINSNFYTKVKFILGKIKM